MNRRTAGLAFALALAIGLSPGEADAASIYQNWYPNTPYVGPSQDYAVYQRSPGGFGYAAVPRGADPYAGGYGAPGSGYGGGYQGISFGGYYDTDYSNYQPPSYYTAPSAYLRSFSYYNDQNNGRDYPASFYSGDGYDFNGHGPYSSCGNLGFRGISYDPGYAANAGLVVSACYQGGIYPSPNRYSQSIGSAQAARYGSPTYQGGFALVPTDGYYAVAGGPLKRSQYYTSAVYTTLGGFRPVGRAYDHRTAGYQPEYADPRAWREVPRGRPDDVRDAYPPAQRSALGPYPAAGWPSTCSEPNAGTTSASAGGSRAAPSGRSTRGRKPRPSNTSGRAQSTVPTGTSAPPERAGRDETDSSPAIELSMGYVATEGLGRRLGC